MNPSPHQLSRTPRRPAPGARDRCASLIMAVRPLIALLAAALLVLPHPSFACMNLAPRGQVDVRELLERLPADPGLPQERSLHEGDLVSLRVPARAVLTILNGTETDRARLIALDEKRYRELADEGKADNTTDVFLRDLLLKAPPPGLAWHRFGAAQAGVVFVKIARGKTSALVRLEILPAAVVERGKTVRGTETQQAEPLWITMFDRLELELPGQPGDGWHASGEPADGLRLAAVEAVMPSKETGAPSMTGQPRVRLRFQQQSLGAETVLHVSNENTRYRFIVRNMPIPMC